MQCSVAAEKYAKMSQDVPVLISLLLCLGNLGLARFLAGQTAMYKIPKICVASVGRLVFSRFGSLL